MKCFLLFILSIPVALSAQIFYVAPGGSMNLSTNSVSPGDLSFAFANAPSNSTVYIKAGSYGAVNLTVGNDSVDFIGYTNLPGDLDSLAMPDSLSNYLPASYALTFPTIDKNNRSTGGTGITVGRNHTRISGMYIRNYEVGLSQSGYYCHFENLLLDGFGDSNQSYHGWGLTSYGSNNLIANCFLLNAAAEGFTIKGNNNHVRHSKCYANDNTGYASTDYYFIFTFNSGSGVGRNNLMEHCYAERVGNLNHGGHGFCVVGFYIHAPCNPGYCYDPGFRTDSVIYNTVRNCTTRNVAETVLLRGANTCYNTFINVNSVSDGGLYPIWGCKFNDFINCTINYGRVGIRYVASTFGDTTDQNVSYNAQSAYPWEQKICAEGNRFINCLFNRVMTGISHDSYSEHLNLTDSTFMNRTHRKIVKGNQYINCTFIANDTAQNVPLFYAMRGDTLNRMINCVIYGFDRFETRYFSYSTSQNVINYHGIVPTKYTFDHCNFYNNGFNSQVIQNGYLAPQPYGFIPGYNDSLAGTFVQCNVLDPGFINANTQNYHLTGIPNSGTVDKGHSITDMQNMGLGWVNFDLDSLARPCSTWYDIGAYEFLCNSGTAEENPASFLLSPNPCSGTFTVKSSLQISDIRVTDVLGRNIPVTRPYPATEGLFSINAPSGIYVVMLITGKQQLSCKLIIKK